MTRRSVKRLARGGESPQLALFDEASQATGDGEAAGPPSPLLRHPRAQRELLLGPHVVAYELRRARRRSIGFIVGAEGLSVAAPRWVAQGDIEAALREKSAWILRKLAEQVERAQRNEAARVEWRDGATLPFLGEPVQIVLDGRSASAVLQAEPAPRRLHLGLPRGATAAQIRDAVQGWLQRQARRVFEQRCQIYARRLGVTMTSLRLSSAQTRWGSASTDGSVRLNWRLIHLGLPTIDYVVAHELAHLRHMDHSARFWDAVGSVIPDYKAARGRLKDSVLPVFE